MQALDRKFIKTYEASATKRPFKYTTIVRYKGTVIAFAMDDGQRIYYTVLNLDRKDSDTQPNSKGSIDPNLDLNFWDVEPQELRFPRELGQVGYTAASLQSIPFYRKAGGEVTDGSVLNENETDWFMSTTARFTADAPFQVLSDEKYVYVFRQAIAENDRERNLYVKNKDGKETAFVNNTLLLDRFVYVDGKLTQKLEVRYQRSRNKNLPASRKDALGYADLEKRSFYEPTQELSFIRNLVGGQFSVLLVPTALPDVQRWQIFAYNSISQRMDSFNIERSQDGLFNTRGTRYYTSSDPQRQKDVFERSPIDPATGQATLVPIASQEGYAESALRFDGIGTFVTIPPVKRSDPAQQDFTIELWVQAASLDNSSPECTLLEQREKSGFPYSIRYFPSGEKAGEVWVGRSDGTTQVEITSTQKINDGKFHHIAFVRTTIEKADRSKEAQLLLLIDGQASGSPTVDITKPTTSESPIFLASRDKVTNFFTGTIDELRIWQRGRSGEELRDDMHHRLIGNEPGLVGYWRFDEGTGTTLYDQTDFVNHAQLAYTNLPNSVSEIQQLEAEVQQLEAATQVIAVQNGIIGPSLKVGVGNHIVKPLYNVATWFSIQVPDLLEVYLEWSAMSPPTFKKQPRTVTIPSGTTFKSDAQGTIDRIIVKATASDTFAEKQQQLKAKQSLLNQRKNPLQSMWITSEASVGEHPGVRRLSFTIADRTFVSGCSALLYYQQEPAETGYSLTETKPIKRNARVMLSMATAPKAVVADAKNYIAVMDFAVSREGTLAQIPDIVSLPSLKTSESQNPSLDAISALEQRIIMLRGEVAQLKPEIAALTEQQQQRSLKLQLGSVRMYLNDDASTTSNLYPRSGKLSLPYAVSMYSFDVSEGFQLRFEGSERKPTRGGGWIDTAFSLLLTKGLHERWLGDGGSLQNVMLWVEVAPSFQNELNQISVELEEKRSRLAAREKELNESQTELNRLRAIVAKNQPLPMAFLYADTNGLTVLGSLLEFAWTKDAPFLFESVDGRLSLYFRGEADQFFAAYYTVMTSRASFRLPTLDAQDKPDGELRFVARTAGATMGATQITIADSPSSAPVGTCQVTIANPTLNFQEVWQQVPCEPQQFAAVLNGTTQPIYIGKLTSALNGEVSYLEIDGRRSSLQPGATLMVGNAQTRVTIVDSDPKKDAIADSKLIIQISPVTLKADQNESVYLLPYDYATLAKTEPQQIGWSLQNGSRLFSVESTQAGGMTVSTQTAERTNSGESSVWFADSQGNALNFDGTTSTIAPVTNTTDFAATGDCTMEAWICPTMMTNTMSVIQQASPESSYQLTLQPVNLKSALAFDGIQDAIAIPAKTWEPDLDSGAYEDESDWLGTSPSFISKSFTIEAKIYLEQDSNRGERTLLTTEKGSFQIGIRDGKLCVQTRTQDGAKAYLSEQALSLQKWYHISCIYDADNPYNGRKLYCLIDGQLASQQPLLPGQLRLDRGILMIGRASSGNGFKGRIDEVGIWNYVRSADKIQANANRRLKGQEPGLIRYWHFENGLAHDYSDFKNDGVLLGNPQLALGSLQPYRLRASVGDQVQETSELLLCHEWNHVAAVFNQSYALKFDGDALVNCGTEKTLDITDSLTIEAFIQPQQINGKRYIIRKGKASEGMPYSLYLDSDKKLHFAFENESGQYKEDSSSTTPSLLVDNTFYRVAVTREKRTETNPALPEGEPFDPSKHKVKTVYDVRYFVQLASGETKEAGQFQEEISARSSNQDCVIGENFQGAIAEVRIWNTARTQAELFVKLTGNEKGLVSWWQFEENQGNIAYDSKSNNHGTRQGATWIKSPDPQGSQLWLYVNGQKQLTDSVAPLPPIEPQFSLGTLKVGNTEQQGFQGQLDEIRIWQTARTEEQIQDNLFRRLMSDFEHLIAYYDCDANKSLMDQSGRKLDLQLNSPNTAFVLSTAPISNETAKVRSALAQVKTDFHDVISSTPGVQEYGDKQYDSDGNLVGVMKRCYSYIQSGKWQLITGFKVGDLEMEWIGQAQYEPQLVGFIEGAPPVPSENLTIRDANQGEVYNEVSAIELTEADRVTYTYAASKENGMDTSLRFKAGVGLKSDSEAGIGFATSIEESEFIVGLQGNIDTSNGWLNEQQVGFAKGTTRLSRLNAQGNWEHPERIQFKDLGRRYIPKNVGFALVKSKTADIFAMRLKHRNPTKRVTVALSLQPNPDIPEDWNIITFPINPRYTKQGTLDGLVGHSEEKDYPNAKNYSSDRSYFKPIEAYTLKNQIEKEQQQLTADYLNYSTNPLKGFKNQEEISQRLPAANQMNLFNTYVWTADGGLFAETQNTMNLKQEVISGSYSVSGMAGAFVEAETAISKVAVMFQLEALMGGHLNLISQKTRDSETAFEVKVDLDVERDISIKGEYDTDGNPMKCPGKVDAYRFMTFYLKPDQEHFKDFSNKVIDRTWLDQSSDANAAALRQAIASKNGTPWRVLHRVTYVSRVLPQLNASPIEETLRAANIESNWELIKQLEPYVKSKTTYAELKQAVEQAIDRYLPELAPAKADIVKYMSLYYQVF